MNTQQVIEALNDAVRIELTAAVQYQQQGLLVRGLWRRAYADFFFDESDQARLHARRWGQKIVALGGVPTVEIDTVHQALEIERMLQHALAIEREGKAAYERALDVAREDTALRNMLEEQVDAEQRHIEELELYLDEVKTATVEGEIRLIRSRYQPSPSA